MSMNLKDPSSNAVDQMEEEDRQLRGFDEALPAIRGSIAGTHKEAELKSAGHVARHAPTNLAPAGPRWIERASVLSRLITL